MKKLILLSLICLFALTGFGQITITDRGDAISVGDGSNAFIFSKSGLMIQKVNQNIVFIAGGGVYRYPLEDIDTPPYSTIDSVYNEIVGWVTTIYSFSGGITGDTSIFDYLEGDTAQINKMLQPDVNDGAPLGIADQAWSDLFLASGAVIGFNDGDVTITHSSNLLTIAGGNLTVPTLVAGTSILPDADQGADLGAIGAVWNYSYSDSTITNYLSSGEITDGTFTANGGSFTGVTTIDASGDITLTGGDVYGDTAKFLHYGGHSPFTIGLGNNMDINATTNLFGYGISGLVLEAQNDGGKLFTGVFDLSGMGADTTFAAAWFKNDFSESYEVRVDSGSLYIGSGYGLAGAGNIQIGDNNNDDDVININGTAYYNGVELNSSDSVFADYFGGNNDSPFLISNNRTALGYNDIYIDLGFDTDSVLCLGVENGSQGIGIDYNSGHKHIFIYTDSLDIVSDSLFLHGQEIVNFVQVDSSASFKLIKDGTEWGIYNLIDKDGDIAYLNIEVGNAAQDIDMSVDHESQTFKLSSANGGYTRMVTDSLDITADSLILHGAMRITESLRVTDSIIQGRFRWSVKGSPPNDTLILIRGVADTLEWHPPRNP